MTKNQACEQCVKRKVRCDRGQPCSNCKRRKVMRCAYPSLSAQDRIKQLETLVEELGGRDQPSSERVSPEDDAEKPDGQVDGPTSQEGSLLLDFLQSQFRGQQINTPRDVRNNNGTKRARTKLLYPLQERPHALEGLGASTTGVSLNSVVERLPEPDHANALWDIFMDRVEPIVRICYRWWLKTFRANAVRTETHQLLSKAEHALLSAIYLISAISMSEEECVRLLQQPSYAIVAQYQSLCDAALLQTNLLCLNDILVMKAIVFYAMANYDRLSMQSLSSLMGLTIRNAERMGMHQDGAELGLQPVQIEDHRRLWWQLQHIDMGISVKTGSASLTFMADWTSKIPLNIEDDDISPTSKELPPARKGLTNISIHRFVSLLVNQQRKLHNNRSGRSTAPGESDTAPLPLLKDDEIVKFEEKINTEFMQYCDPIQPVHVLIQFWARFLIAGMRLWTLYQSARKDEEGNVSEAHRNAVLETAIQCLQYNNTARAHPDLERYYWITKEWTPYHALICVLIEAAREEDIGKAKVIWDSISKTYATDSIFWKLSGDHRRIRAAELVVSAWKTWQHRFSSGSSLFNPGFIEKLEEKLVEERQRANGEPLRNPVQKQVLPASNALLTPQSIALDDDIDAIFDMDLHNIDWSFWGSVEY